MATDLERLLGEVQRIRLTLEANSEIADRQRRLPDVVYDEMIDAGLYRTLAPRAFGGLELHPVEHCRVIEEVARIDSAAGWNLNQSTVGAGLVPWMTQQGGEEVYARGADTIFSGGLFPPGPSIETDDGWRITSRSSFASGCDRAHWYLIPVLEVQDELSKFDPRTEDPPVIGAFLPRDEIDIVDNWNTVGMRGTFSAEIVADDVFVPKSRIAVFENPHDRPPAFSNPLYGLWPWTSGHGEAAVSLGIACAAVDKLVELTTRKTPSYGRTHLRDREVVQNQAAKAKAMVDASRSYLDASITEAYSDAEKHGYYEEETKIRCQLAQCFCVQACAEAVDLVYEACGSSSFRVENGIERHHRDIHVLTQHAYKSYSRYEDVGKMLFGLPPTFWALRI